ncbi:hypothetical protein ACHAW6_007624 [Cyclotella cf. meneghiniana]
MKKIITEKYKMKAAKVAIQNFKSHFLSILTGVSDDFSLKLGQAITTDGNHYQFTMPIQCNTHSLCIYALEWPLRLQQNATCSNGLKCPNS